MRAEPTCIAQYIPTPAPTPNQIEPNAYAGTSATFNDDFYIFHYTYGIEYK